MKRSMSMKIPQRTSHRLLKIQTEVVTNTDLIQDKLSVKEYEDSFKGELVLRMPIDKRQRVKGNLNFLNKYIDNKPNESYNNKNER